MKKLLPFALFIIPIIITFIFISIQSYITASPKAISESFDLQKTKRFEITAQNQTPINILASTLPQFVMNLADQKFSNLWIAHAQERESLVKSQVTAIDGHNIDAKTSFDDNKKELIVTPQTTANFKPGLYKLNITVKTYQGKDITITQDFTWGVIAINTNKATYLPGETVQIGMGVLDDKGYTKCIAKGDISFDTAKVWLMVTSPSGKKVTFSTDEGTILGSRECARTSVTNNPDFQTAFNVNEVGRYTITMTAENINGKRSSEDSFTVSREIQPFVIMRNSYPTRIYPYGHYPVELTVKANQDYMGQVSDFVPNNFQISHISEHGRTLKNDPYQQITWNVNWHKGQTYKLQYEIQFPFISPEFYLVGPLTIGDFNEGREWQIASDDIALVQSASNVVNSGTSVSATFPSAVTANHLDVLICSETGSATISTPSRSGGRSWSSPTSLSVTSTPRIRMFYRRSQAGESSTFTCSFGSSTGVKAIQMFEYSGISTSGMLDATGKLSGASCNSSPFHATVSLTTTNGNELVLSSHVSTTLRTVNSHTSGFTQEFGFNGSSGTFTSADQIITDAGAYSDTVTFSGGAGTCSGVIASFITPVTLTQNGFQFFENANSVTPGSPMGSQNDPLTLPKAHDPFRIRMLVDVDGNQTVSLGGLDLILQYAEAPTSGDCSTLADTDWNPVTSSTPIAYNSNTLSGGSGSNISTTANDPIDTSPHTYTTYLENYYESFSADGTDDVSNLQNSLANNRAGMWDFSLIDNTDDIQSKTYCLELVSGDGTGAVSGNLDSYLQYPKVTTFYNEVNIKSGTTIKGGTTIF